MPQKARFQKRKAPTKTANSKKEREAVYLARIRGLYILFDRTQPAVSWTVYDAETGKHAAFYDPATGKAKIGTRRTEFTADFEMIDAASAYLINK